MHHRFSVRFHLFLSHLALQGCGIFDNPTTKPSLDDQACLTVDADRDCLGADDAADQLVGSETCESPVRQIVGLGDFLGEDVVVFDGYGGVHPYESGDTGLGFGRPVRQCCYEAAYEVLDDLSCTPGRPCRVDGEAQLASATPHAGWQGTAVPSVEGLSAAVRATLADRWERDALVEHASVAAFARLSLELLAHGAPAELLARTAQAMSDEVRHAQLCFGMASAYGGAPSGPSPLEIPARPVPTLAELAVETFVEGCINEACAAASAAETLAQQTDPVVRSVLQRIVVDETRHAQLAWDTLAWALDVGGPDVRDAVAESAAHVVIPPKLAALFASVIGPTLDELLVS